MSAAPASVGPQPAARPPGAPARATLFFLAFVLAYTVAAFLLRFPQDDIHFFLRMAQNWTEGLGFYYSPALGDIPAHGQANSNLLYSLLLALPFLLGIDPYTGAAFIDVMFLPASLWLLWGVAREVWPGSALRRWLFLLLVPLNWTFFSFTTDGLGTPMLVFASCACLFLVSRVAATGGGTREVALLACVLAYAALCRWDAGSFALPAWAVAVFLVWRGRANSGRRRAAARIVALTLVPALAVLLGGGFRLLYWGDAVPLSYWHKLAVPGVPPDWYVSKGLTYTSLFLRQYGFLHLAPFLAAGLFAIRFRGLFAAAAPALGAPPKAPTAAGKWALICAAAMFAGRTLYLVRAGGGYIEFRLFAAVIPCLLLVSCHLLFSLGGRRAALLAALVTQAFSVLHARTFTEQHGIIPSGGRSETPDYWRKRLSFSFLDLPNARLPLELRRLFGDFNPDVLIATTIGGLLAYHSRQHVIEMHGWTDKRVIFNAIYCPVDYTCDNKIGHLLYPRPAYLAQRRVNLVIGHPAYILETERQDAETIRAFLRERKALIARTIFFPKAEFGDDARFAVPAGTMVGALPFAPDLRLLFVYLTPSPYLDGLFAGRGDIPMVRLFGPGEDEVGIFASGTPPLRGDDPGRD